MYRILTVNLLLRSWARLVGYETEMLLHRHFRIFHFFVRGVAPLDVLGSLHLFIFFALSYLWFITAWRLRVLSLLSVFMCDACNLVCLAVAYQCALLPLQAFYVVLFCVGNASTNLSLWFLECLCVVVAYEYFNRIFIVSLLFLFLCFITSLGNIDP